MDWQNLLFNTHGRIGQGDFWKGVAVIIGGNVLVNILPLIGGLLWMALIWVGVAVYGKRLHDTGRSAWFHAIPWGVNLVIFSIGLMMVGGVVLAAIITDGEVKPWLALSAGGLGATLIGLTQLIWLIYTFWLGLAAGEPGANRFGPAPVIELEARPADDR